MAFEHNAVIQAQWNQLAAERAQAVADYEAGRTAEDEYSTMSAANRLLDAEAKLTALDRVAGAYASQQQQHAQQQKYNPHGLSRDELDVAKISGITGEQYAHNKRRMQMMKDQGYWSQGKVFK
jgi:hypothetical protein